MTGKDGVYEIIGFVEETARGMTLDPEAEIVFGQPGRAESGSETDSGEEPQPSEGPG